MGSSFGTRKKTGDSGIDKGPGLTVDDGQVRDTQRDRPPWPGKGIADPASFLCARSALRIDSSLHRASTISTLVLFAPCKFARNAKTDGRVELEHEAGGC